jgi:formamidopyrimidine-DNA glycosylase
MPELPDVEGFRQVLASCAHGRRVRRVEVADPGVLHGVSPRRLGQSLTGRRFDEPERHGKWLIARTDGPALLVHFGMTGRLVCCSPTDPRAAHDRVVLTFDGDRQLRYRDQRKLRGIWFAPAETDVQRILAEQGPDALRVGGAELDELLAGRRRSIKATLIDQSLLAGIGNLLGDEILWQARVHPARRASDLTAAERRGVGTAMRRVLRTSVRAGCIPARRTWLTGRRDESDPTCPRYGTRLRRGRIAGRGTTWCPDCQRNGSRRGP